MQRKPFWKLLLLGIGFMMLGNIMSTIMTVAMAVVMEYTAAQVVLFIMTFFVFYSLVFTVAYKDGERERAMVKNHRVEAPIKLRWVKIGVCMWLVMIIPSVILLVMRLMEVQSAYVITYRMICGAIYPLSFLVGIVSENVADIAIFHPFIFMGVYALIPLATHIGFKFGFEDKFNPQIMYEKK